MNRHERRKANKTQRPNETEVDCAIQFDGKEMYFVIDGQRMARRGHPGTPEARQWIPLVPGFSMHDNLYGGDIDALVDGPMEVMFGNRVN